MDSASPHAARPFGSSLSGLTIPTEPSLLERFLRARLEGDGIPRGVPVTSWWPLLTQIDRAGTAIGGSLGERATEALRAFLLATLRFSRPDGSAVFGPRDAAEDRAGVLRRWVLRLEDPGLAQVARWWFGRRAGCATLGPPPLPAFGRTARPLAMLRADWRPRGDLVAIDHREPAGATALEVQVAGGTLLGPSWVAGGGATGRSRGVGYRSGPLADWFEWAVPAGSSRVIRTAVLLRGQRLALLADEWHRAGSALTSRLGLAEGIAATAIPETRALALKGPGVSARALPLALPALPYPTERGALVAEAGTLLLSQRAETRRAWLPLLLSWDPARNRRLARWRSLTVAERSKVCPPGVAFAARVAWGPGDGLVIYRSLARPALRSFLGHQTSARFLIGLFDAKGNVKPLLKVE